MFRNGGRRCSSWRIRVTERARAEAEAAVVAYASGPADTRAGLADVLYRLRAAAGQLEGLAAGYRDAIDTAARLTGP